MQFDAPGRGFSFQRDEPLDMRMDRSGGDTAADLVARVDRARARRRDLRSTAKSGFRGASRARIVEARREAPIDDDRPAGGDRPPRDPARAATMRIDPATRTFQALRIWVNRELDGLDRFLEAAARRLRAGARLVVITFHSLEDRIVKHTLRALEQQRDGAVQGADEEADRARATTKCSATRARAAPSCARRRSRLA